MKLKAAATRTLPESLFEAFDSSTTADEFKRITISHLRVRLDDFGPTTHFVQETDPIIPTSDGAIGISVVWSQVSVTSRRAPDDFKAALKAIERYYYRLIAQHLPLGQEAQLFCVMALDLPVKFPGEEPTNLIELPAKRVVENGKQTK